MRNNSCLGSVGLAVAIAMTAPGCGTAEATNQEAVRVVTVGQLAQAISDTSTDSLPPGAAKLAARLEDGIERMELIVPYLNQNKVPGGFGSSACGCTSTETVLAYWGVVSSDTRDMETDVANCYKSPGMNYPSSTKIQSRLLNSPYSFSSVEITHVNPKDRAALYAKIQGEILAGRPMILSSWRFTSAGHFVVVTGFNGSSYSSSATIVANDPFGPWGGGGPGDYPPTRLGIDAQGVEYNFDLVTANDPANGTGNLITINY